MIFCSKWPSTKWRCHHKHCQGISYCHCLVVKWSFSLYTHGEENKSSKVQTLNACHATRVSLISSYSHIHTNNVHSSIPCFLWTFHIKSKLNCITDLLWNCYSELSISFFVQCTCYQTKLGTLTKSQNWPAGLVILKMIVFFRKFSPKTHHCYAYYVEIYWSSWTILINSEFSLQKAWSGWTVLTSGKRPRSFNYRSPPHHEEKSKELSCY